MVFQQIRKAFKSRLRPILGGNLIKPVLQPIGVAINENGNRFPCPRRYLVWLSRSTTAAGLYSISCHKNRSLSFFVIRHPLHRFCQPFSFIGLIV
ncbi:MAG: hypothetical protein ACO3AG_06595, partial [Fluviibacter sp.]